MLIFNLSRVSIEKLIPKNTEKHQKMPKNTKNQTKNTKKHQELSKKYQKSNKITLMT